MRFWVLMAALVAASIPALAQDEIQIKPLTGSYTMAPAIDNEDPKAPADQVYLTVTGDAAKAMWDAMPVEATEDACIARMSKWAKTLACYGPVTPDSPVDLEPGASPYECLLGVDLKNGALALSHNC